MRTTIAIFALLLPTACAATTDSDEALPDDSESAAEGDEEALKGARTIWVEEVVTSTVSAQFKKFHAQSTANITQHFIDPNGDGQFDKDALRRGLDQFVPTTSFSGPISLDWEGGGIATLIKEPTTSAKFKNQVAQYVAAVKEARRLRPKAKIGFYGLPLTNYYHRDAAWHARTAAMQAIFDASNAVMPTIYDPYKSGAPGQPSLASDQAFVREMVTIALQVAKGKPVLPFVWHRYHDTNAKYGNQDIPSDELRDQSKEAFAPVVGGRRAQGFIWWGHDLPPPSHAFDQVHLRALAAFRAAADAYP